nr:unnamed protein product [Digitaria exilis]
MIQGLKASVKEESERRLRYKVDESIANTGTIQIDPRLPALYVEADRLAGIDGPRDKIVDWLMKDDSTRKLKVVSIVGFGGLGKTTLARQVFNRIKSEFVSLAFVPVSRNPNIKKILTDMLKEIGCGVDTSDDERQLIDKLRAHLQDKRYLIIVDDIWSTAAWESVNDKLGDHDIGRYQKALESSLSLLAKHKLNSLDINFGNYPASDKLMDSLCSDAPCLKKLVELCILGGIPTLLYLNLLSSEAPSERLTISSKQFCCLKEFVFRSKGVGGLRIVCEKEAMPKLKNFTLEFNAKETEFCLGFEFCFEHLASLDQLSVNINCNGATRSSVEAAEAAIMNTASIHPGRPALQIHMWTNREMAEDKDESETQMEDNTRNNEKVQLVHA